jgi:hypothetical protein
LKEYLFLKGYLAKRIYDDMSVPLGDKRPSCSIAKNRVDGFGAGEWSSAGEEHSGRPTGVTVPQNVDVIHSMILDDGRISSERQ